MFWITSLNIHQIKIDRYWTCNKELTNLKYITINEDQLKYEEQHLIFLNQNKIIYNEKKQPTCKLHSRIISETIETIERTAVTQTIDKWQYYITNKHNKTKTKILFITLTISDTINTKIDHKKLLKNYIEKLQYTIGKFNYISKIEFQENGNIHWHIMQDKEVGWKIVRGIWNKTQIEYVNGYQKKMLKKYKNGFFFDTEMKTKSGEIIDYETQLRRYKIGTKANWRNPNSTDVKTINENEYDQIGSYINKYLNKKEEDKNIHQIKIDRY